jgi:uncharacterized membrane protein HdeD (DUF308 family)
MIGGLAEVMAAFRRNEAVGTRTPFILGGLVSVAFGVVLFAHPAVGAITLALLFGLFNLAYGARSLMQGIELRRMTKAAPSAAPDEYPARSMSGYRHSTAA